MTQLNILGNKFILLKKKSFYLHFSELELSIPPNTMNSNSYY